MCSSNAERCLAISSRRAEMSCSMEVAGTLLAVPVGAAGGVGDDAATALLAP
jgi:hypothetical protein